MAYRRVASTVCVFASAIVIVSMASGPVVGQAPTAGADTWDALRTPWGDPDLQGTWDFGTITPLERPQGLEDQAFLTSEEVAGLNAAAEIRASSDRREELTPEQDVALAYDQFWWDRGIALDRTSLIVDPPDGRLPPYTQEGQERRDASRDGYDSWEDRGLTERCLVYRPVPVLSTGYNNHNVIVQAPGYVTMYQEQIHEIRIIPLDGRPHLGENIRPWLGDSRGHWEGTTLVVETTNFHEKTNYVGSGGNRHVVERFTPVSADTLRYSFTVTDPTTWTRPWTGEVPWRRDARPVFEYACHEGNYGMVNLLAGERALEKAAADASK